MHKNNLIKNKWVWGSRSINAWLLCAAADAFRSVGKVAWSEIVFLFI